MHDACVFLMSASGSLAAKVSVLYVRVPVIFLSSFVCVSRVRELLITRNPFLHCWVVASKKKREDDEEASETGLVQVVGLIDNNGVAVLGDITCTIPYTRASV